MNDKGILSIALTLALIFGAIAYFVIDGQRGTQISNAQLQSSALAGQKLFGQYCAQCHGPLGEGCIGPAVQRGEWRAKEVGGDATADLDAAHDYINKTLHQGRQGIQPNPQVPNMPAWGQENGGSLNTEQINNLTDYLQYGDFSNTLYYVPSANLAGDIPNAPGDPAGRNKGMKEMLLGYGCLNCHLVGNVGGQVAANLSAVGGRRTQNWLTAWIYNPQEMPAWNRGPYTWSFTATQTMRLYNTTPMPTLPAYTQTVVMGQPAVAIVDKAAHMNPSYMPKIEFQDRDNNGINDLFDIAGYLSRLR